MAARLFVGNLPFTTTENDLQDHFAQSGGVFAVNIMQDRATGRSRGFAFVEMTDPAEADKASAALTGTNLGGRTLKINAAKDKAVQ
jgi:RNA recognition motif-containing protein